MQEFLYEKQFFIPLYQIYQMAYSWEKPMTSILGWFNRSHKRRKWLLFWQCAFIKIDNAKFDVIDGQQRVSIIAIFMRCFINVLELQQYDTEKLEYIKDNFLDFRGNPKLNTVEWKKLFLWYGY